MTEPENTEMPPSPETQLATMGIQMGHILEKVNLISMQQSSFQDIARSVAIHDEKIDHVSKRVGDIDDRFNSHSDNIIERLQSISQQITDSNRAADEKTTSSLVRVHERLDGNEQRIADCMNSHESKVNDVVTELASAKGSADTLKWVVGGFFVAFLSGWAWVFTTINASHDTTIRQDERIKIIEQHMEADEKNGVNLNGNQRKG